MSCYLFVHFVGETNADGEQIYFSVSCDGLHWRDLNGGLPVLRSPLGDCGVRDPFLVRHPKSGRYYLMATDLSMYHRQDWKEAEHHGSRALIIWESDNLVDWSAPRRVEVGAEYAGCVWAPESIWDSDKNAFIVYFASMVQFSNDPAPKQRIYAVYTQDFLVFTEPFIYAEAENHLIDMTIVYDKGWYYRFIKDESTKKIVMERMQGLRSQPEAVDSKLLASLPGLEGPECYQLPDGRWCLIADQFAAKLGYLPLLTDDLATGDFRMLDSNEYDLGTAKKRHGGVIAISEAEMQRLLQAFSPSVDN